MTTIVYRNRVMAADSRAYSGHATPIGSKQKIAVLGNGALIGVSTTQPGLAEAVINYFEELATIDDRPEGSAIHVPEFTAALSVLLVNPDGTVMFASDSLMLAGPITADFFAIGSGAEYALGALSCGVSAEDAVRMAIEHDPFSGFPVTSLDLDTDEFRSLAA
jgi:20S proteasome alpha/beta subunit